MLDFGQEKRAKSFVEFLVSNIHTDLMNLTDLFLMMIALLLEDHRKNTFIVLRTIKRPLFSNKVILQTK